jgi:APA family basic amino acid/polyamine antiporter
MEAGTATPESAKEPPSLFVRNSSGLLKSWSTRDAFLYATLSVNFVALGLYYGLSVTSFVPDGQVLTAVLVTGVLVTSLVIVYSSLISTMPRAGGDYLWQSRTLGGSIAFVLAITGWVFILWHWAPIYGDILVVEVLVPVFTILEMPDAASWIAGESGVFVTSLAVIALAGILVAIGMEAYARFQKVAFGGAVLGLLIMLGLLLFSSQGAFESAVNRESAELLGAGGNAYQGTIDAAARNDYVAQDLSLGSLSPSMLLIPFLLFFLLYPNWGATLYGEIRGTNSFTRVFWPMFTGLWVTVAITVIFVLLASKTMGWDFYTAANYNYWSEVGAANGVSTIFPFPGLLAGWLVDSAAFQIVLILLLSLWFFAWMGTLFLSSTRVIFAAAFDRILPEWAAAISERRRVPIGALAIMLLPSIPISAIYAYSASFSEYTLAATLVIAVTFFGSGVAATILPWRRPEMWANSPASRYKIGPVPLVTVAGLVMLGFLGWTIYKWLSDDLYALNNTDSFLYMGGLYVLALAVYVVARLLRARQGFNLGAVQKEIPAE